MMKSSLKKTERKIKLIFELKNLLTAYEKEKIYKNKSTQNLKAINLENTQMVTTESLEYKFPKAK